MKKLHKKIHKLDKTWEIWGFQRLMQLILISKLLKLKYRNIHKFEEALLYLFSGKVITNDKSKAFELKKRKI